MTTVHSKCDLQGLTCYAVTWTRFGLHLYMKIAVRCADLIKSLHHPSTDPPPQAPVISRSPLSLTPYSGDDLTLTCEVTGGKPLVTFVSLTCSSRHPDKPSDVTGSDSVSSSLQMTLTDDDDGITCSCTAVCKVTSFYTLSDSTTFTVYCESLHVIFLLFCSFLF